MHHFLGRHCPKYCFDSVQYFCQWLIPTPINMVKWGLYLTPRLVFKDLRHVSNVTPRNDGDCIDAGFHQGRLRDVRASRRPAEYDVSWRRTVRLHSLVASLQHATHTQVRSRPTQRQLTAITESVPTSRQDIQKQPHCSTALIIDNCHLVFPFLLHCAL